MYISSGEKRLKQLLDIVLPSEIHEENYRPDWLKNPNTGANLELDRYYPGLKIGIEFNGQQHRKKNSEYQWQKDKIKRHLCGKHGVIRLVFYNNELDITIVRQKIDDTISMRKAWASGKAWSRSS